ncbi:hypothetical protein MRB53_040473 [Persea americana]|nr:hypothetical protein MRB53_040473 [Persea americana]
MTRNTHILSAVYHAAQSAALVRGEECTATARTRHATKARRGTNRQTVYRYNDGAILWDFTPIPVTRLSSHIKNLPRRASSLASPHLTYPVSNTAIARSQLRQDGHVQPATNTHAEPVCSLIESMTPSRSMSDIAP